MLYISKMGYFISKNSLIDGKDNQEHPSLAEEL